MEMSVVIYLLCKSLIELVWGLPALIGLGLTCPVYYVGIGASKVVLLMLHSCQRFGAWCCVSCQRRRAYCVVEYSVYMYASL